MDRYELCVAHRFSGLHSIKASYNYSVSGLGTQYATYSNSGSFADFDNHELFYQLHIHDVGIINVVTQHSTDQWFLQDLGVKAIFASANLRDQRITYFNNKYPDNIPRTGNSILLASTQTSLLDSL